jgi:coatomer subunit beta'
MLLDASAEPTDLPLSLLKEITNNFSDNQQVGRGGFAVVYKVNTSILPWISVPIDLKTNVKAMSLPLQGLLQNGTVAVKKLSQILDVVEKNFHREVECLMRVKHKNIVRFLGYCGDTQVKMCNYEGKLVMADVRERLLCFEFVSNGSLDGYIAGMFLYILFILENPYEPLKCRMFMAFRFLHP